MTRPTTAFALIWLLGFFAFAPSLSGPWLLDDLTIQDTIATLHADGFGALADGGWETHLFLGGSGLGRPLSMVSLAGNALISAEPFGFKLVNLLLHLVTATLVYLLARRLLGTCHPTATADTAALAVALIWTLHPLHLGTVAYVVQRMTILSALFSTWAMLAYVRLRLHTSAGTGGRVATVSWVIPFLILPTLATLSKESGALTPLFLFLVEISLFRFQGSARTRRLLMGLFGFTLALLAAATLWVLVATRWYEAAFAARPFDLAERLMTQGRVVSHYVGQILLPRLGAMPFFYDGMPHSTGWLSPPSTLVSALALLAALGAGIGLLRRRPLAALGILLFFAGHLMESSVLPLELAFEHRNYLPSLGLILAAVDLALWVPSLTRLGSGLAAIAVATVLALCLIRALAWGSAQQIYATALGGPWPSLRARAQMAQILTDQGYLAAARDLIASAEGVGPRMHEGYLDCLEQARLDPGRIHAARAQLGRALSDYDSGALIEIINLDLDANCDVPTPQLLTLVEEASAAAAVQPASRQKLLMYVGHLRHELGDIEGAGVAAEAAFAALPANPLPLLLAGHWRLDAGDESQARDLYGRARAQGSPARLNLEARFEELAARLKQPRAAESIRPPKAAFGNPGRE